MASNLMIPHLFSFLLIVLFDFLWLQFREKSSQLKENALFNVSHMKNIFDFLKAKDIWKLTDKMKKRRAEENSKQLQRKSIESQSPFELKKKNSLQKQRIWARVYTCSTKRHWNRFLKAFSAVLSLFHQQWRPPLLLPSKSNYFISLELFSEPRASIHLKQTRIIRWIKEPSWFYCVSHT